jgi:hypothetical protein
MTREKKVLVTLYHLMAFALVAGNSDASTFFQSEAGFTITYPERYRTNQAESPPLQSSTSISPTAPLSMPLQ